MFNNRSRRNAKLKVTKDLGIKTRHIKSEQVNQYLDLISVAITGLREIGVPENSIERAYCEEYGELFDDAIANLIAEQKKLWQNVEKYDERFREPDEDDGLEELDMLTDSIVPVEDLMASQVD